MKSQSKHTWYKKESKKEHKRCEIKIDSQSLLLLMKIFDNDDQAATHYCCLPTA